jgi:hypothetical protein
VANEVVLEVRGDAPAGVAAEARVRLAHALAQVGVQVADLRIRLSDAAGQLSGTVLAQANALAVGRRVRVQVVGATCGQALEALILRLSRRISEATTRWTPRSWPDPQDPSGWLADGRHVVPRGGWVVRVKPHALIWCEPAVAVATMDAVAYRAGPTGYRLARLRSTAPPSRRGVPLPMDPRPAPVLSRDQAVACPDRTGLAHFFFADGVSGRGRLLYRRFDGHYALIAGAA